MVEHAAVAVAQVGIKNFAEDHADVLVGLECSPNVNRRVRREG